MTITEINNQLHYLESCIALKEQERAVAEMASLKEHISMEIKCLQTAWQTAYRRLRKESNDLEYRRGRNRIAY